MPTAAVTPDNSHSAIDHVKYNSAHCKPMPRFQMMF